MLGLESWDIDDLPDEVVDWIWKGYLAVGNLTVLAAPPKAGKSTLLFHLLRAINGELPLLGLETQRVPALLFTEESVSLVRRRREGIGQLRVVPLAPGITWPKVLAAVRWWGEQGYKLMILDTVSRFWPVQNEGDAVQVLQALTPLMAICRATGVGALLIHHTRKGGGAEGNAMRGSNAILGTADIGMEMGRITPWDRSNHRRIDALSRYDETPDSLRIELLEDGYHLMEEGTVIEKDIMFLVTAEGSVTAEQLCDATSMTPQYVRRVLSEMAARGVLERTGTGSRGSPFRFALKGVE